MFLSVPRSGWLAVSLSLTLVASAQAQEKKAEDRVEKGEGVILRVEPIATKGERDKDKKEVRRVKITVNTAAVWADYARDQTNLKKTPDAKQGENSVATKGQPDSPITEIIAEVDPSTRVVLRYRTPTDEASKGSRTIEKAQKKDGSTEAEDVKTSPRDEKAPKMTVADLKPGLFVAVETKKGKASQVIVLKAVTPPSPKTDDEKKK